ncbi:MAG: pyrroline-5-carboxylate reductase [Acidobacteria bacterium]|nr:MAG: pyrroline-5-carboxylate reductase [Acidobacteriota bacterium]REK02760.1 MAG: pyrroline-5-carboxylate reductase [Acidobacteriota bacterium]REK13435.1 MAG: pyrroline-5-carboxylate reductase [Acidobacteriota bacterium]REK41429.1 MAG: pyrroline-5-carboxylate reductase [Acidobacteriota bacterium]
MTKIGETTKETREELADSSLAFIGCGVMAESIIAGLLKNELVPADKIVASHPREERRRQLGEKYGIDVFSNNAEAVKAASGSEHPIVILCVKPQRADKVMKDISNAIDNQLVLSIVAGCRIDTISSALGTDRVGRTMPNTPSQIGHGITAWTATEAVTESDRSRISSLLSALGREMYVENEHMIDMATSLSATGPTYIFLVMEALTDAGVHLGFSRDMSKELVQETMLGAVLFAMESDLHPAELRNMVTSPGGTSADAIYQMEKGGLRTVLSKAVFAAYQKAVELGEEKD